MAVPVLKQGDYLIASIQSALSDDELVQLQHDLVGRARRFHSRGVVVDVTVMDVLDSFACRTLRTMADVLSLTGADTVVVGIAPEVAFAMVQMGLTLQHIPAALDLEDGLALLARRLERRRHGT